MKRKTKNETKKESAQTDYKKQYREFFKTAYIQPQIVLPENHSLEQPSLYKPIQSVSIFGNCEEAITF